MSSVFSHIVQARLSRENENVATEALAYIVGHSEAARRGLAKLVRGLVPELQDLRFRTQQTEGSIRPDMWGYADAEPRVYFENKFWAGLTDNQPVEYLKKLAAYKQPTALLVVAPTAREHTLWSELIRRLDNDGLAWTALDAVTGIAQSVSTGLGPVLALTSWSNVLSILEHEAVDDPAARGDLTQLRALCVAADADAFAPLTAEELSDQRTPALMLQLSVVFQRAIDKAVAGGVLNLGGTRTQADAERIGRYAYFGDERQAGAWLGLHFRLWRKHGVTPFWAVFAATEWGRASDVRSLLVPWASKKGVLAVNDDDGSFVVALNLVPGEEQGAVVAAIADQLQEMFQYLQAQEPVDGTVAPGE